MKGPWDVGDQQMGLLLTASSCGLGEASAFTATVDQVGCNGQCPQGNMGGAMQLLPWAGLGF